MKKKVIFYMLFGFIFILVALGVYKVFINYKSSSNPSASNANISTILLNKKEVILKEDGDIFVLVASVPDINSDEIFSFSSSNEEAIELTSDGPNKVIIKRLKLFSDTITISISNNNIETKAVCNVRCYNDINDLGDFIINEVKDASGTIYDVFKNMTSLVLKQDLTYDMSLEIRTIFSSLQEDDTNYYSLENEDITIIENALKVFFEGNQIINVREEKTDDNKTYVRFMLLYSNDIFFGEKNITKPMKVKEINKDYTIFNYQFANSVSFSNSSEFVI